MQGALRDTIDSEKQHAAVWKFRAYESSKVMNTERRN